MHTVPRGSWRCMYRPPKLLLMPTDQEWPYELDALVAAPRNHALLFENETIRVLEIRIAPGDTTPLHTHRWPGTLLLLSWSDCVRRMPPALYLWIAEPSCNLSKAQRSGRHPCPRTPSKTWARPSCASSVSNSRSSHRLHPQPKSRRHTIQQHTPSCPLGRDSLPVVTLFASRSCGKIG